MPAPWTEVKRKLESGIRRGEANNRLEQMVKSHEIDQVIRNIANLEHTISEVSTSYDNLRYEFETLREEVRQLKEET